MKNQHDPQLGLTALLGVRLFGLVVRGRMELSGDADTIPCAKLFVSREAAEAEKPLFRQRCLEPCAQRNNS